MQITSIDVLAKIARAKIEAFGDAHIQEVHEHRLFQILEMRVMQPKLGLVAKQQLKSLGAWSQSLRFRLA